MVTPRLGMGILALLVSLAGPQGGWAFTGEELLERCEAEGDWYAQGLCGGYVSGLDRGYRLGRTWGAMQVLHGQRLEEWIRAGEQKAELGAEIDRVEGEIRTYCLPDGLTRGELVRTVVRYLRENPTLRHGEAELLVPAALATAWPCE